MKNKRFSHIVGTNKWKCLKCGKVVEEMGWAGHLRMHTDRTQERNKHIDTY